MVAIPEGQITSVLSSLPLGALGTLWRDGQRVSIMARRSKLESHVCDH